MIKRFRVHPIPVRILVLILISAVLALISWMVFRIRNQQPEINDFDSCVAAGNPILETYPEQCTYNGQSFFREGQEPYDPKDDLEQ